jgi:hypothetical protein
MGATTGRGKQDDVSLPCLVAVELVEETEARVRIGLVHEEGKLCPGSLTLVCGEDLDSGNEAVCQVAGNRVSGQGVVSAFLVCGRETDSNLSRDPAISPAAAASPSVGYGRRVGRPGHKFGCFTIYI